MKITNGPLCLKCDLGGTTWQWQQVGPTEGRVLDFVQSQALILTLSVLIIIDSSGISANILHF